MKLHPTSGYENHIRIQNLVESGQIGKAREVFQEFKRIDPEGADLIHAAIQFAYGIDL